MWQSTALGQFMVAFKEEGLNMDEEAIEVVPVKIMKGYVWAGL